MAATQSFVGTCALVLLVGLEGARDQLTPAAPGLPLDPISATIDAFSQHSLVCLGDTHGDRLGEAFQVRLIEEPRFADAIERRLRLTASESNA
jgi:hypothetical protein